MNKRALITGINGMDGSHLADLLLDKGYEVFGMERRSSSKNRTNTQHLEGNISLNWIDHENSLPVELLWPTTAKRFDYWRTVLEQLISLRDLFPETLLILLVELKLLIQIQVSEYLKKIFFLSIIF